MRDRVSFEEISQILRDNNQEYLIEKYDRLTAGEKAELLTQIAGISWDWISDVLHKKVKPGYSYTPTRTITIKEYEEDKHSYWERGQFLLRAGKVAVLLIANDTGERLKIEKPKGEMNVGLTKQVYIYELLIRRLAGEIKAIKAQVPLLIMTSKMFEERIKKFFFNHKFFGYTGEKPVFFPEGEYICVDFKGRPILDAPGHIATLPGGDGSFYKSMDELGLINELERKGIEWLSIYNEENLLANPADSGFIGAVAGEGFDCGIKVVRKTGVFEKLSTPCLRNGSPVVLDYIDMDDNTKAKKDENGELVFPYGACVNMVFRLDALRRLEKKSAPARASKVKVDYMDQKGIINSPLEPNGYRFKQKASDLISIMDNCLCFEISRSREYAMVRNTKGQDTAITARSILTQNGVTL